MGLDPEKADEVERDFIQIFSRFFLSCELV